MCNCIKETLETVKKTVKERLPKNAEKETLSIDWANRVFRLDDKGAGVMLRMDMSFWKTKTSGERYKNKATDKINIAMSYCPFCGEKYA